MYLLLSVFAGMSVEGCFDCWLIQEEPGRVAGTILWWPGIPEQDKLASKGGCFSLLLLLTVGLM